VEVWHTSNLRRLRIGEEKKKEEEEQTTAQKYNGLLLHRAAIKRTRRSFGGRPLPAAYNGIV